MIQQPPVVVYSWMVKQLYAVVNTCENACCCEQLYVSTIWLWIFCCREQLYKQQPSIVVNDCKVQQPSVVVNICIMVQSSFVVNRYMNNTYLL